MVARADEVEAQAVQPEPVLRIAVQGSPACFSEQAAMQLCPAGQVVYCRLMEDAFEAVLAGKADAVVLPVRNTIAGDITPHLDLVRDYEARLGRGFDQAGQTDVPIRMCLLAPVGATLESVRQVYSHPVALRQCEGFFRQHPDMQPLPFHDTAGALEHVMREGDPGKAALASVAAGERYRAITLARNTQDIPENYTHFWLLLRRS